MKLQTIYKKTKTGATQEWTIEVSDNKYRSHSGQVGGQITTNEWTVVYGKNVGKANGTTDEQQAMAEAVAKRTKKLESGYFEDVNKINEQQYFEPMLAAKWEDYKDKIQYPIYSQLSWMVLDVSLQRMVCLVEMENQLYQHHIYLIR